MLLPLLLLLLMALAARGLNDFSRGSPGPAGRQAVEHGIWLAEVSVVITFDARVVLFCVLVVLGPGCPGRKNPVPAVAMMTWKVPMKALGKLNKHSQGS
jgi:hypothetical protein